MRGAGGEAAGDVAWLRHAALARCSALKGDSIGNSVLNQTTNYYVKP